MSEKKKQKTGTCPVCNSPIYNGMTYCGLMCSLKDPDGPRKRPDGKTVFETYR